jgi:MFS family permease
MSRKNRFARIATAGITFQAGSAAIDSSTIMSALVFQLTGNPIAVGAVTAILRFGWLFPQLIVGFLAQRGGSSMRYYVIGAFGRASCMAILALVLFIGSGWSALILSILVMSIWTAYAFISGIVAVPYNDIVARSVPSELRSRLLATRFFGGGVLALGVVFIADRLVGAMEFPSSYAAIIALASVLMFLSSGVFTVLGEPEAAPEKSRKPTFYQYLKDGAEVFRSDVKFRNFVYAQWCGGAVLMAMPFYVVQADANGIDLRNVALLLGVQTVGALVSNALWGWWGDKHGKASLLKGIAIGRILPPALVVLLAFTQPFNAAQMLYLYAGMFFILGALANGLTIAVIGFLMEISPDHLRPAYSGYFNAISAPAFLLPLLAGIIAASFGLVIVFIISMIAAVLQAYFLMQDA